MLIFYFLLIESLAATHTAGIGCLSAIVVYFVHIFQCQHFGQNTERCLY